MTIYNLTDTIIRIVDENNSIIREFDVYEKNDENYYDFHPSIIRKTIKKREPIILNGVTIEQLNRVCDLDVDIEEIKNHFYIVDADIIDYFDRSDIVCPGPGPSYYDFDKKRVVKICKNLIKKID